MTCVKLTGGRSRAKTHSMGRTEANIGAKGAAIVIAATSLAGCVTVEAPTEPIVIELNVNIRQEVIYRLAEDAGNTIEENADIF